MSSELVHDADASVTALLHMKMEQEARAGLVSPMFYREVVIDGPSLAYKVSKHPVTADAGTLTDGTALSNVGINPTTVSATAAGIGLKSIITKFATSGSLLTEQEAIGNFARGLINKMDVDGCSLLDNLGGAAGTSATDLGVGDVLNAIYDLEEANEATNMVAVLDPLQVYDLRSAIVTSSAPVWGNEGGSPVAGLLNAAQSGAYKGSLFGVPIYVTSNVVDDATNKIGGLFNAGRALLWAWKWYPTVETRPEPDYGAEAKMLVVSAAYGIIEVHDLAGVAVTSGNT